MLPVLLPVLFAVLLPALLAVLFADGCLTVSRKASFQVRQGGSKRDRARDDYPPVYDGLHSFSAIRYKGGRL